MRGFNYTKASRVVDDRVPSNSVLSEALAKQAANRPPKAPPKVIALTPAMPKMSKPGRRRRTV